jgi:autotransporter-associated beta strand protein
MAGFSKRSLRARRRSMTFGRGSAVIAAAALSGLMGRAWGDTVYWDVNGTSPNSGVVAANPDWLNGTISSAGVWDGTLSNWNTISSGGTGGTLRPDIGAGNDGIFSAGTDATGSYIIELPDNANLSASSLSITQGSLAIAGDGNGGQSTVYGGSAPSIINIGSGTFNINVGTGAALHFGYRLRLPTFAGSAVITKTGGGYFNNISDEFHLSAGQFTGKWDVQAGTMGILFGGNSMLGNPAAFTPDQVKVSNNAVIQTLQGGSSVSFRTNEGITIGPGGGTFFFAGSKTLDPTIAYTALASVQFTSRITGGAPGAEVPITITSNTLTGSAGLGQSTGATGFAFLDNSVTTGTAAPLYARWIIKSGEIGPVVSGTDHGLGAEPALYQSDAITLDGGYLRPNANMTINSTRGITLGNAGGGLHPVNATTLTISSKITGGGQLRVYLENNINGRVVLAGANDYTGGTWITGVAGVNSQGALQGTTTSLQGNIQNDGRLIFDQTITGSYAGSISSTGSVTKSNTGTAVLTGTNTYTGATNVTGGTLVVTQTTRKSASLSVSDGARAVMSARTSPGAKVLQVGTLNLNASGTLDMNDNDLVVSSGNFNTIQGLVLGGYRGGPDSTATGIISTTSQTVHGGTTILAVFENSLAGFGDWPQGSGQTIAGAAIVGKYTYIGDTNMDGQVTPQDYTATDSNLGTSVPLGISWFYGDTNFDGNIDPTDYAGIDGALGLGVGNPLAVNGLAAVPEVGSVGAVVGVVLGLMSRRKRRTQG